MYFEHSVNYNMVYNVYNMFMRVKTGFITTQTRPLGI